MLRKRRSPIGDELSFDPPKEIEIFFRSILEGKTRDAEEALGKAIEVLSTYRGWDGFQGYIKGLEGILLSIKEKSRSTYLSELKSLESLKKAKREFTRNIKEKLNAPYDRWYFKALLDYTRFLISSLPNLTDKG